MASDISIKLAVEGEQNFKTAISSANAQIKAMDAEMKAAISGMDDMASSEEKAAAKSKILAQQIDTNKEKLSVLNRQYDNAKERLNALAQELERAKAKEGDNAAEVSKAANAYNSQAKKVADLERDIANTNTAINNETAELKQLNNTLAQTGEKWQQVGANISSAGEKISSVGSTLTKGVTTPLIAAGTAASKFASDYEENLNKVDASFKDNAQEVKAWAKTATEQFGMSESAALEATSLFGDMGTSMGLTTKEAASMSTSLAGLAGDLSSFKNIGIDEAMTALKGVFTGETESLKTLGVVMTETNLKAFAEDMGLVYDSMSQAEKVTLRYQYVLANTANAHGDYARTSDGTANSVRTLQAETSNLAAAFGEELLPQITPLIQKATELVRGFGELDQETKQNIIQAGLMAAATGPVVTGVGKVTEGVGAAVEKAGAFAKALSGGGGLASALTSTLGTGGTVGLAVAGVAALTAVSIELGNTIYELTDPITQVKKHLENMETAQESLSDAENIVGLCQRYEELRERTSDTSLSSEELAAVQEELTEIRASLSEATGGAVTTEGEYNETLDRSVQVQKELAEAEKERSNQEIYIQLVKGAKDYQKALQDQREKQDEITKAQSRMEQYNNRLSAAVEQYSAEMAESGKVTSATSIEMDDAATCAEGATQAYNDLVVELSEMQSATTAYQQSLMGLVQDGFLSATDAASLLGVSEDALARMMTTYWNETHQASTGTQALAEDHLEAAQAAQEQAAAEQEATSAIWDIASAAVDARTSGGDLRAAYEELSGQLEKVRADGDETAIMWTEQKLQMLNVAATNQELSQSFMEMGVAASGNLSELSQLLIDAGVDADTYASGVASMRDSVINSYKAIVDENSITLEQMKAAQTANLQTTQQWGADLESAWQQAYAAQDTQVMAYINYLYELGPEYATAVHEMMEGGYEELQANAQQWGEAGTLAAQLHSEHIYAEQELARQTGQEYGNATLEGLESVDMSGAGQGYVDQVTGAVTSNQGAAESAMQGMGEGMASAYEGTTNVAENAADNVTSSMISQVEASLEDMKRAGSDLVVYLTAGVASKLSDARDVTENVVEAAKAAAGSVDFKPVGQNISAGIASGIRAGRSGVVNAAVDVVNAAVSAAKSAADIHSPSRVMRDEVGAQLTAGVAEGMVDHDALSDLKEAADVVTGIVTDGLSGLNAGIAAIELAQEQRAAEKELREFEESMAELRQKYAEAELEDRADILKQINEKQADWDEKRLKEQEAAQVESLKSQISYLEEFQNAYDTALKDYQDSYQDAYNGIMSQQAAMADKMASFGDLFTYNDSNSASLRLGDLEQQTLALEEYGEMLERLQERGISEDLMQEVLGMDIRDAWNYGSRLLGLSDQSYEKYMASWAKKQETAAAIAEKFYADDLDNLKDEYIDKIPEVMDGLKDQMGDLGTDAAQALAAAFEAQQDAIAQSFVSTVQAAYDRAAQSISAPVSADYVTREDLYKATSGAVNGLSMAMATNQPQQAGEINMYINDTKIATAMLPSLRAVSKANPEVVNDR